MLNLLLVISIGLSSYIAFNRPDVWYKFAFNPFIVRKDKEYARFLSVGWVHADFTHLLLNLIVLYSFGQFVEGRFNFYYGSVGSIYYVLLFTLSVILANLTTYFRYNQNPSYTAVGASGGVSGVLFASILMNPTSDLYLYFAIPIKAYLFGILYMIYSVYQSKKNNDHINHEAHFTGAIAGVVIAILIRPSFVLEFWDEMMFYLGFA